MAATSHKTLRKPAKGGLANALFVAAPVEALPDELSGVADRVTVLFPWGSLLRAVAAPDVELLSNVRRLCRAGATLEVVLGYDCARERSEVERLALPELTEHHLTAELPRGYRDAGFRVGRVEAMTRESLRALPSTWAKRLAFGRPRDVWRIVARAN
jgi:16S rRNA (adenine(1408)-N(1))-methyltransferase